MSTIVTKNYEIHVRKKIYYITMITGYILHNDLYKKTLKVVHLQQV